MKPAAPSVLTINGGSSSIKFALFQAAQERHLNMIYITGPGHGGPGVVANTYLEGTYSELYPNISQDEVGMRRLFKQFSFPGGIPSHVAPETPGSIHEGGELGYALSHAFGAAFDNPDLIVACVVGDGEAETGPLATSWHSNKFLNPVRDGVVLPILHLNGYKIAGPTVLARIPQEELEALFHGYGYEPHFVEGDEPELVHQQMLWIAFPVSERARLTRSNSFGTSSLTTRITSAPTARTCPRCATGSGKPNESAGNRYRWDSRQGPGGGSGAGTGVCFRTYPTGIKEIVNQQFEVAAQIITVGLVPIVEPEVDIHCPEKSKAEALLKAAILEKLNRLPAGQLLFLKLTLPEQDDLYADCVRNPNVVKVLALSGGYSRDEGNARLRRNHGVVASFSRGLVEGLSVQQSEAEFNTLLDAAIQSIFEAPTLKQDARRRTSAEGDDVKAAA